MSLYRIRITTCGKHFWYTSQPEVEIFLVQKKVLFWWVTCAEVWSLHAARNHVRKHRDLLQRQEQSLLVKDRYETIEEE